MSVAVESMAAPSSYLKSIKSTPRLLFLIDGGGAIVSALFLGIVLVQLKDLVGMPVGVLYLLAALPAVFAIYSLSCYFFIQRGLGPFLRIIATANLAYCCLTSALMVRHFSSLTALGIGYFVIEIVIVVVLASFELKAARPI